MKPIINGSLKPTRTRLRTSYDPQRGVTVTQEYECAGDGLNGLANSFLATQVAFDLVSNPRRSSLVATSSGPTSGVAETPIDTWQLLCNEQQNHVKEHPAVIRLEADSPGTLAEVLQAVRDYEEEGDTSYNSTTGVAGLLYRRLIHGATHYPIGQYVLKHTTNVSNRYDTNVADLGVEYIYSTTDLIFEVTNPSYWLFPCPGRLVRKIERMENQVVGVSTAELTWGWRKLPSQETTAANSRIDISTEYWLAGWSVLTNAPL